MSPARKAGGRLHRVPDGVPVVEHRPQLGLLLVSLHHARLQPAGAGDHSGERLDLPCDQGHPVLFQIGEVVGVQHDAMLDDFRQSGAELTFRQGGQRRRIHEDNSGLVKGTDEILGPRMVDGGLPADRRVHLGEQRGGELDEVDAAHVGGGHEAREIAHRAAPQRHHGGSAVQARGQQRVPAAARHLHRLGRLTRG